MTYALECLQRLKDQHERVEVVFGDRPIIRCRSCGHAVLPAPRK
jgi:hypothetical protein